MSKYAGSTPWPWYLRILQAGESDEAGLITRGSHANKIVPVADAALIADAPKLLAQRDELRGALADLMEAVGDMPADPNDYWPEEWQAAEDALTECKED